MQHKWPKFKTFSLWLLREKNVNLRTFYVLCVFQIDVLSHHNLVWGNISRVQLPYEGMYLMSCEPYDLEADSRHHHTLGKGKPSAPLFLIPLLSVKRLGIQIS